MFGDEVEELECSATGSDGKVFTIPESIKTDWKDNANAGVAIVAADYRLQLRISQRELRRVSHKKHTQDITLAPEAVRDILRRDRMEVLQTCET